MNLIRVQSPRIRCKRDSLGARRSVRRTVAYFSERNKPSGAALPERDFSARNRTLRNANRIFEAGPASVREKFFADGYVLSFSHPLLVFSALLVALFFPRPATYRDQWNEYNVTSHGSAARQNIKKNVSFCCPGVCGTTVRFLHLATSVRDYFRMRWARFC